MRWVIVWLCMCQDTPLAVHVANTEANCHSFAQALTARIGGAYICARYHDEMTAENIELWKD